MPLLPHPLTVVGFSRVQNKGKDPGSSRSLEPSAQSEMDKCGAGKTETKGGEEMQRSLNPSDEETGARGAGQTCPHVYPAPFLASAPSALQVNGSFKGATPDAHSAFPTPVVSQRFHLMLNSALGGGEAGAPGPHAHIQDPQTLARSEVNWGLPASDMVLGWLRATAPGGL